MGKSQLICTLFLILTGTLVFAGQRLAVLPLHANGVDQSTVQTFSELLRNELSKHDKFSLLSGKQMDQYGEYCMDSDCAADIGENVQADLVLAVSLNRLGEKIIVHFILTDVHKRETQLADNSSVPGVDELDVMARRIANSISSGKLIDQTAEVGQVLKEDEKAFIRRKAAKYLGLTFGYTYPLEGYEDKDRVFSLNLILGYDTGSLMAGVQGGARYGVTASVFCDYLFSRSDFSPFLGLAAGFHWVAHDNEPDKHEDGFMLAANAGLVAFRTYNFQLRVNCEYAVTFNDYDDSALTLMIGLLKN